MLGLMNIEDMHQIPALNLYIHIPFCTSRCSYCNFYFITSRSQRIYQKILDTILIESREWFVRLGEPSIKTVYFGGGTPSIIPPAMLADFLEEFRNIWQINTRELREWTFECNPESLSRELTQVLSKNHVTRLSMGVQSFQDPMLQTLGRRASASDVTRGMQVLNSHWASKRWNLDLITGIPGQSSDLLRDDLQQAFNYDPKHISLYSLTIEEDTPLSQAIEHGELPPPDQEESDELWLQAKDFIEAQGLMHYEASNFSVEGHEALHNRAVWDLEPYLGLGPGAVSTLPSGPTAKRITRGSVFNYGKSHEEIIIETLSKTDYMKDHLLAGLRTRKGFNEYRFREKFNEHAVNIIQYLEKKYAIRRSNEYLSLPDELWLLSDKVLREVFLEIDRISR
jgi:oxygen-independent coproporphyrinogen-3 oxidase